MSLIARLLPAYHFVERHDIRIAAPAGHVMDAAAAFDPVDDPLVRRVMSLREMPARLAVKLGWPPPNTRNSSGLGMIDFIPLGRDGDREMAFGLIGRFWRPDMGLVPVADAAAFTAFDRPGIAKLVWNFLATPEGDMVRLTTETRVYCPDRRSRWSLAPYWTVIRPASGFIRRRMLAAVKRAAEA